MVNAFKDKDGKSIWKETNIFVSEHKNERGGPAEVITERIVDEQRIDVDTVTGATNSSVVIKKAVENALGKDR